MSSSVLYAKAPPTVKGSKWPSVMYRSPPFGTRVGSRFSILSTSSTERTRFPAQRGTTIHAGSLIARTRADALKGTEDSHCYISRDRLSIPREHSEACQLGAHGMGLLESASVSYDRLSIPRNQRRVMRHEWAGSKPFSTRS